MAQVTNTQPSVYVIENLINGRAYIGWTVNEKRRWYKHRTASRTGRSYLYRAMRKHGIENFVMHHVDDYETRDAAKAGEVEWIAYLRMMRVKLYNETDGGDGTSGRKNSPETIAKMKAAHKGKIISPEQRAQISKTLKKFNEEIGMSPETRAKISERLKGKQKPLRTPEHCEKLRKAAIARDSHVTSDKTREKMRQAAYTREERKKLGLPSLRELKRQARLDKS